MLLLDVGAGNQPCHKKGYETIGMDRHDFSADYSPPDKFVHNDLLDFFWPFKDKSIDFIWCHHALEHLPHQLPDGQDALVAVINEMGRIIKPGCEAHLIVPWIKHTNAWRHPGHYRFFNKDLFAWFSHTNKTPDHQAYGYINKMVYKKCWIQDECHVYAIFEGI